MSNQQNLFFAVRRSIPPRYWGKIVIHYDELENSSRLVESVLPLQAIDVISSLFIANTEMSINLRNFSDQITRFATLCDIVLYGPKAETFAEIISKAQQNLLQVWQQQLDAVKKSAGRRAVIHANKIEYKTIIIKDGMILCFTFFTY